MVPSWFVVRDTDVVVAVVVILLLLLLLRRCPYLIWGGAIAVAVDVVLYQLASERFFLL